MVMNGVRELKLNVNGEYRSIVADVDTALLYLLRNDFALNGPKYGCGLGECGACAVIVDGVAARSCVLPARKVEGRVILTLEGLGTPERPHPVQRAFIEEQAAQCGYCLNGMIMTVKALIDRRPDANEAEIRFELQHNLCRCGAQTEILRAAALAVNLVRMSRNTGR
jgi:nicotinate dehydrogenase subunit A